MKILGRRFDKNAAGYVVLVPEEPEDLWAIYNLIHTGDQVKCTTFRRVQKTNAIGSKSSKERKKMTLTITVEKVDFSPEEGAIRVSGPNGTENEFVKVGAYHTLTIDVHQKFTLIKEYWDTISINFLNETLDISNRAEVAALLIDEGLANLYLVTPYMTIDKFHLSVSIPKKRQYSVSKHSNGLTKFFQSVYEGVLRNTRFDVVKCFIIAGPGFLKDQFYNYMMDERQRSGDKLPVEKIILVPAATAHKQSLTDILSNQSVESQIIDTKSSDEVRTLAQFFDVMKENENMAVYGTKEVKYCLEQQAVEALLISDELFRANSVQMRKEYVQIVEQANEANTKVVIFSSLNVAGIKLQQLTGIAAILRFELMMDESSTDTDSEDTD